MSIPRVPLMVDKRIRPVNIEAVLVLLSKMRRNLRWIINIDGTRVLYYTQLTKRQAKKWFLSKKTETFCSTRKVMSTIFWDMEWILLTNILLKEILDRFDNKLKKTYYWHHDNAPPNSIIWIALQITASTWLGNPAAFLCSLAQGKWMAGTAQTKSSPKQESLLYGRNVGKKVEAIYIFIPNLTHFSSTLKWARAFFGNM